MNGRIYDPTLGRFLQADPHIQAPKNSQSYNRYSYVLNNPLSYTDPSGYFFDKIFRAINKVLGDFAPFVAAALMFIPGVGQWAAANMWNAAAVGFVSGGIATGSLKGALIGAFTGAAFQQIGAHYRGLSAQNVDNVAFGGGQFGDYVDFGGSLLTKGQVAGQIASHAVAGGVISTLSGGKFGHGFFSAGVTKGIGGAYLPGGSDLSSGEIAKGAVVSAVIGGTASVISGGKFANGAKTASFQYLFNQAGGKILSQQASRGRKALDALIQEHGLRKSDIIAANAYLKTDMSLEEFTELFPQFAGKNELLVDAQLSVFSGEFSKTVAFYEGIDFGMAFGESAVKSWWGPLEWLQFGVAEMTTHNISNQQIIKTFGDAYYAPPKN